MSKATRCTIGVLSPFTGGFYYGAILQGIQRVAQARGAVVVVIESQGAELCWPGTDQCLGLDVIDGWLAVNEFDDQRYLQEILGANAPVVSINSRGQQTPSCAVLPDNHGGTQRAVAHLVDHGHRRIAFAGSTHHDLLERREGYLAGMRAAGLEDNCLMLATSSTLELDGRALGRQLASNGFQFTALVAGTDKLALGLAAELTALGHEIPHKLALVGFDDIDEAQYANPPLTTVRQSFALVASTATNALLDHLVSGAALPETIRVPTQLIQRRSCGCTLMESLRPPALAGSLESCTRALVEELESMVQRAGAEPGEVSAWSGAIRIAEYLAAAVRGEAATDELAGAWKGFLKHARDAERVDKVLFVLESTARVWCNDLDKHPAVVRALRDQGLLAPGRFLPVADELGLTVPISHWVLTAACEQAKAWRRAGRSRYVSVNVPAQHLQQDNLVGFVRELLQRFDLDPRVLCLELVESTLIEHRERTTQTLSELIDIGVRVAIDDFGTGYSSLGYLRDFPLSLLKIDRSFVREIPSNPKDSAIAQAIITMGQGLGLAVVAEGVETEAQFDFLRSAGCDLIQGYFVGRPMSVEDWDTRARPRPTSTTMERVGPGH